MKFSTIIFDMDGVVVDTEPIWKKATMKFLQRRGITQDIDKDKHKWISKSPVEIMEIMKDLYEFEGDPMELHDERNAIVDEIYQDELQYIKGFEPFIKKVKDSNLKTCIATSSFKKHIDLIDEKLNITAKFGQHIYSIADVGNIGKPNPDLFLFAAEKLNSSPSDCIVIEDSPNGVQAAKNAEMFCIALSQQDTEEHKRRLLNADIIVESFEDIDLKELI
ncbi:HAD-IA family hydrolase [Candidatus Dojkabacteria bacterium]|nr:HAD-IA family hydrolase [Candidatus Dojkabacteria bacterium]